MATLITLLTANTANRRIATLRDIGPQLGVELFNSVRSAEYKEWVVPVVFSVLLW